MVCGRAQRLLPSRLLRTVQITAHRHSQLQCSVGHVTWCWFGFTTRERRAAQKVHLKKRVSAGALFSADALAQFSSHDPTAVLPIHAQQMASFNLPLHQHGKSRVRLGRTWREGDVHHFVEWNVNTMLESPMEHAFMQGDNTGMTATDTQKNTVYVVAQRISQKCSVEEYAIALAKHFVQQYPLVTKAKVYIEQKPWTRVDVGGRPHDHGYAVSGTETRTVYVTYDKANKLEVTAGLKDLQVLKTTQSGYVGFLRDQYTMLPEVKDRILATSVTSSWKYATQPADYDAAYNAAKTAMFELFFGPSRGGVYSPSVQYTLWEMGKAVLQKVPQASSVFFNAPNLHFLPCSPPTSSFKDDVYVATSEPHGNIECTITRDTAPPHIQSKL